MCIGNTTALICVVLYASLSEVRWVFASYTPDCAEVSDLRLIWGSTYFPGLRPCDDSPVHIPQIAPRSPTFGLSGVRHTFRAFGPVTILLSIYPRLRRGLRPSAYLGFDILSGPPALRRFLELVSLLFYFIAQPLLSILCWPLSFFYVLAGRVRTGRRGRGGAGCRLTTWTGRRRRPSGWPAGCRAAGWAAAGRWRRCRTTRTRVPQRRRS